MEEREKRKGEMTRQYNEERKGGERKEGRPVRKTE